MNEADLTQKKEQLNEIGEWVEKIRIFVEWRKIMEEEIISYMTTLASHVKNCEVSAICGRRISLVGKGLKGAKLPIGFAIRITGNTVEFGSRFVEIIVEHIYRHKISIMIKEDKEKRLMLLRKELRTQIKDHEMLNRNPTKIIENLSSLHNIKATFEKLWVIFEERRANNGENSESNETSEINVTNQHESDEVKDFFYKIINIQKNLLSDKLREDDKILEIEQKDLQEKHKNKEYEVKELEAKLEKENLVFFSKAQIEVSSRQD